MIDAVPGEYAFSKFPYFLETMQNLVISVVRNVTVFPLPFNVTKLLQDACEKVHRKAVIAVGLVVRG